MRTPLMLLLGAIGMVSATTDGRAQNNTTDLTRFLECSELVDCLLSPQGPHVLHENTWRRLVRRTSESGSVFFYLLNDNAIPPANQGRRISLLYTTASVGKYWPKEGNSPELTPTKGGCTQNPDILPGDWAWGGWPPYRQQLTQLGMPEKHNGNSTVFCTDEHDLRKALKKELENLPQAYSAEATRQLLKDLLNKQKQDNERLGMSFTNLTRDPALLEALAAQLASNDDFLIKFLENQRVSGMISRLVASCVKALKEGADTLQCR